MIYDDGYNLDVDNRVIVCPKCENEEFSDKVEFCRICGTVLYNYCEGEYDTDYDVHIKHNNPGNARFCETCGKPTHFLTDGFLRTWNEVKEFEQASSGHATAIDFNNNLSFNDDEMPF